MAFGSRTSSDALTHHAKLAKMVTWMMALTKVTAFTWEQQQSQAIHRRDTPSDDVRILFVAFTEGNKKEELGASIEIDYTPEQVLAINH